MCLPLVCILRIFILVHQFEERIPFPSHKIRLVERGSSQASKWLVGAMISIPAADGYTKTKKKITEINVGDSPPDPDCSENVYCVVKGKHHSRQEIPYKNALELLFSEHRADCKEQRQLFRWPGADSGSKTEVVSANVDEINAVSSDCAENTESHEKVKEEKVALNSQEHLIKAPKVGDLVRVLYKQEGMFSEVTEELWAMAEVLNVQKKANDKGPGYQLNIKYSDYQEDEVEYPDDDVEMIIRSSGSKSSVYETVDGSNPGSFACDKNPCSLMAGDYVECLHQNGKFKGRWYAGRVASTSQCGEKVDIAYFDGEVRFIYSFCVLYFVSRSVLMALPP